MSADARWHRFVAGGLGEMPLGQNQWGLLFLSLEPSTSAHEGISRQALTIFRSCLMVLDVGGRLGGLELGWLCLAVASRLVDF